MNFKKLFEMLKQYVQRGVQPNTSVFYTKTNTYVVSYVVEVSNSIVEENDVLVLIPVPHTAGYQKLPEEPLFFPENVIRGRDKNFGNQFAVWNLRLKSGEQKILREDCLVTVSPREGKINSSLKVDDYISSKFTDYALYMRPNEYIAAGDTRITTLAGELAAGERRVIPILRAIHEYVVTHLIYGNPIEGLYSSLEALEKKEVDCGGFATLSSALAIARGIPCRVISGFFAGYAENTMHAWVEALLPDGTWFPFDPSLEYLRARKKTEKPGGFGTVGSDRIVCSVGSGMQIDVLGKEFVLDILQNPIAISEHGGDSLSLTHSFNVRRQ